MITGTNDTQGSVQSMLRWVAPEEPADWHAISVLLAQGSGVRRREAEIVLERLVEEGTLLFDVDHRAVTLVGDLPELHRRDVARSTLERQRRIVRDTWLKALKRADDYDDVAWLLPHVLYYYAQLTAANHSRPVRKPDFQLRLFAAEALAICADVMQSRGMLELLNREHLVCPQQWDMQHSAHKHYVEALIAIQEQDWEVAETALTLAYDLWLESNPRFLVETEGSELRGKFAQMSPRELRDILGELWDSLFNNLLTETALDGLDDMVATSGGDGEGWSGTSAKNGATYRLSTTSRMRRTPSEMTVTDVAAFLRTKLQRTALLSISGFVAQEEACYRLPQPVSWPNARYDPNDIERWYLERFSVHQKGETTLTVDAQELRNALKFVSTRYTIVGQVPEAVILEACSSELPYLQLQINNAIARVPAVQVGQLPWRCAISYETLYWWIKSVHTPIGLTVDEGCRNVVLTARSKQGSLETTDAGSWNMIQESWFIDPADDVLLAWLHGSTSEIGKFLFGHLPKPDRGGDPAADTRAEITREEVSCYLARPCLLTLSKSTAKERESVRFTVGEDTWRKTAYIYGVWDDVIPLENLLWLNTPELRLKPWLLLSRDGGIALANQHWTHEVFTR